MTTTCRCGKPTRDDRSLCDQHRTELDQALGNIRFIDEQTEIHLTRQKAAAIGGSAASFEKGLPWHEKAGDARRNLHGLLAMWVRFCWEENVRGAPEDWPADNLPSLAAWLLHCTDGLALLDIGAEAHDEITDAVAECRRIVFWKKRERVYLGPCGLVCECDCHPDGECEGCACAERLTPEPCAGEVYAEPDEPVGYCDDCERGHTVVIRRGELEQEMDARLCTPAEIARMSTFLGLDVPRDQVRRRVLYWARHKRIEEKGRSDKDEPLFRYGEVRSHLYREYAPKSASA